eukprot:g12308.t1
MGFQVQSFVSSVLDDAVDCFLDDTLYDSHDEAAAVEYFPEDFLDLDAKDPQTVDPDPVETVDVAQLSKSPVFQYVCRLLDCALNREAQVFVKPDNAVLLAGKRYAESRDLLPLDCLPLSPALALAGPRGSILWPRPPSMPRVRQPRVNFRPFLKPQLGLTNEAPVKLTAERRPEPSATSAMALDLGNARGIRVAGELKLRLREADDTDMKVHHEALTETQDEVEDRRRLTGGDRTSAKDHEGMVWYANAMWIWRQR